jgi:hypothetical protein
MGTQLANNMGLKEGTHTLAEVCISPSVSGACPACARVCMFFHVSMHHFVFLNHFKGLASD